MRRYRDDLGRFSDDLHIQRGARLPHWTLHDATYAVNFRLADSLPQHILKKIAEEHDFLIKQIQILQKANPECITARISEKLLLIERLDEYLDAGYGACWLKQDDIAQMIADTLHYEHGKKHDLLTWSIMPNHVHVVFKPKEGHDLLNILYSWKSYSAKQANRILARKGTFWLSEGYDHITRDEYELYRCIIYAWQNPEKAGYKEWLWRWMSEKAKDLVQRHQKDFRF